MPTLVFLFLYKCLCLDKYNIVRQIIAMLSALRSHFNQVKKTKRKLAQKQVREPGSGLMRDRKRSCFGHFLHETIKTFHQLVSTGRHNHLILPILYFLPFLLTVHVSGSTEEALVSYATCTLESCQVFGTCLILLNKWPERDNKYKIYIYIYEWIQR